MRVPELMTETFAAGMTALLGSVIRPVKDAFEDCALTAAGQNTTTAANAMARRDSQQHPELCRLDAMKPADYLPGLILPESFDSLALLHISGVSRTAKPTFSARLSAADKSQAATKRFVTMIQITSPANPWSSDDRRPCFASILDSTLKLRNYGLFTRGTRAR